MAASIEQRVSRIEGDYEHLTTKADLADLRTELKADMAATKVELIKWMAGLMLGAATLATAVALLIQRLIG